MNNRNTILIVEDEKINRKILCRLLQADYDILEASNGKEGFDLLMQQQAYIAAILLDVVMPIMNGYQFLALLEKQGLKGIPVIVTTGASDSESEQKVLEAGAWDFVSKPYNAPVLLTRLKSAIARSQVALYAQMQKMAAHDPLTGLHNRNRMFGQTRKMIDAHPDTLFAFMRFDIDHFALFNTSFGEAEGDKLLKYLAKCLEELSTTVDLCRYCRMNSDVFCACFSYNGDKSFLRQLADDMQQKLSNYKQDYLLQLSVGVCIVTDRTLSVDELYFRATMATHKCKDQYEKHLSFYDSAIGERLAKNMIITNEMQTALDENQFIVFLQPKFNVSTETICGAEALVRWQHPVKGMISPGDFIPLFEKNGFITKLDYYVWQQTCAMLHAWIQAGKTPYPISVNVSRISLYNPNIVTLLNNLVEEYQLSHSLLQLEITESAYMTNPELMEATIYSFHEAGFTILMDDFGSGYSSLNTLKRIYIDILKIDMRFLPVGNETERGEIILACIIKMAKLLGMSVITEGVETRRQRDFLEGAGCDSIQGYYYSKPIPQSEYEEKYINDQLSEACACLATAQKDPYTPKHNATILVMDNSEEDCVTVQQNLKELYHVHICHNAEAGLAYLKHNMSHVKLIILDNLMSGMSGLQFLKYSRLYPTLRAIPKIMITAHDSIADQVEAFREGAYDYITKPLITEVLLARVNHVMAVSRQSFGLDTIERDYQKIIERDVLTGLLNKIAFHELASRVLQSTPEDQNALMVLDVDNFKQINDEYGHLVGDQVLKCIADELRNALRKTDIIGRFGGDEFTVMMTRIPNHEVVNKKAKTIIKAIVLACANQLNVNTSVSIGIAFSNGTDAEEALFARADQALYEAKNTGKAKAVVYGEKIPPVQDNDKPVVLICSQDPQLYPVIALAYGDNAAFVNITSLNALIAAYEKYHTRIRAICMDMQKKVEKDSKEFYDYIVEHGGGKTTPILAFCKEGNMQQVKQATELDIMDILFLPPHIDIVRHRLSAAITRGQLSLCK